MVQENFGISILPKFYITRMSAKLPIIPLQPPLSQEVVLAMRNKDCIPALSQAFIRTSLDYVRAHRKDAALPDK